MSEINKGTNENSCEDNDERSTDNNNNNNNRMNLTMTRQMLPFGINKMKGATQCQLRHYHSTRFVNDRHKSDNADTADTVDVGDSESNDLKDLEKSEYFSKDGDKHKAEKSMRIIKMLKHRAKSIENSLKDPWKSRTDVKCQYKELQNTAKQKFRSFNAQKKVPAVMLVPKLVPGKKNGNKNYCKSIVMPATAANLLSYAKYSNNIINTNYDCDNNDNNNNNNNIYDFNDEFNGSTFDYENNNNNNNNNNDYGDDDEDVDDNNKSLILSENTENCLSQYKECLYRQLNDLKKENEELKKKIIEIMERKGLKDDLQMNTDHLELEKTKLKACWLIMSSTLDAFSNFCKKLRTKTNDDKVVGDCYPKLSKRKCDVVDGYVIHNNNNNNNSKSNCINYKRKNNLNNSDDFEEALDAAAADDKDDKKYYNFLKKLILDQVENEKARNRIAK